MKTLNRAVVYWLGVFFVCLLGLLLLNSIYPAFSQIAEVSENVEVSISTKDDSLPMYTLKHGNVINLTRKSEGELKKQIDVIKESGFDMITMSYDLIDDNSSKTPRNQWVNGTRIWEGETDSPKFVKDGRDQVIQNVRDYAINNNLQMVMQINGTPYYGETSASLRYHSPTDHGNVSGLDASDQSIFTINRLRRWSGGGNWYPLPMKESARKHLGEKIAEMINAYEANAKNNVPSIWVGQQEVHHTVGFPYTRHSKPFYGDKKSAKEAMNNMQLYAQVWKEVAKNTEAQIGGLQELDKKHTQALKVIYHAGIDLDYFTVQDYQAGTRLGRTAPNQLDEILEKMDNTKLFGDHFSNTQILWHRFNFYKYKDQAKKQKSTARERVNTTAAMIRYLQALKVLTEKCDRVHGYSLDVSTKYFEDSKKPTMLKSVSQWITAISNDGKYNRVRPLNSKQPDLKGFAIASANKAWIVMWNLGTQPRRANVGLNSDNYDNAQCVQMQGRKDNTLKSKIIIKYDNSKNGLEFLVPANGFSLVEVDAAK